MKYQNGCIGGSFHSQITFLEVDSSIIFSHTAVAGSTVQVTGSNIAKKLNAVEGVSKIFHQESIDNGSAAWQN